MKSLTGERRAVAAAVLAFYSFIYLLLMILQPVPDWETAFGAMAGVYALGFFGIVAGYFWARWYVIGLGLSGVITTLVSLWQMGPEPVFLFWGGTHGAVALAMWGESMAKNFDGRAEWRERFHMDEHAVHRLGRAVIRIGISLPYVLLYALAPKPDSAAETMLALGALGFATAGTWAIFRLRTWGIVALAGAAAALAAGAVHGGVAPAGAIGLNLGACAAVASILLFAAVVPFVRPAAQFLRGR